jgi:hypothetical protein
MDPMGRAVALDGVNGRISQGQIASTATDRATGRSHTLVLSPVAAQRR